MKEPNTSYHFDVLTDLLLTLLLVSNLTLFNKTQEIVYAPWFFMTEANQQPTILAYCIYLVIHLFSSMNREQYLLSLKKCNFKQYPIFHINCKEERRLLVCTIHSGGWNGSLWGFVIKNEYHDGNFKLLRWCHTSIYEWSERNWKALKIFLQCCQIFGYPKYWKWMHG